MCNLCGEKVGAIVSPRSYVFLPISSVFGILAVSAFQE